jgi:ribosome-associated translation inhibitor RaiA
VSVATFDVSVVTHGHVGGSAPAYAEEKIRRACRAAAAPVLYARVALTHHGNRSLERPYTAKATVDVGGRLVRAHVAAESAAAAVDALEQRLRRQLAAFAERRETRRRRTGAHAPGEWRHGNLPSERPEYFQRPAEERRVVRRKTFALAALTPDEAAFDLDLLDHDFYLFTDLVSAEEAVVFHSDGHVGIQFLEDSIRAIVPAPYLSTTPAPTLTLAAAIEELDLLDARFVFFRDSETHRGAVVYRRYDGHYGLVLPA